MDRLTPERWRAASPYLDRALGMPEDERRLWLADLRARDAGLADDIEALLDERSEASREAFLEGAPRPPPPPASASLAGQTFGAYTLVSLIGQGGMGNVWLASRSDGRFEGAAAVKLLNASLVGRAGEERFRREGSMLARLADPHIARLLDAGMSPAGQPYLVLEYVEGEPIDEYCDARSLSVEARIRLFLDVLEAIAHAHANLIVHRDIKPSNVLVDMDGQAKLLDFGIAKLLEAEGEAGAATTITREAGRALTPEFAAPEQITGAAVTTATDVYALGTLLYLLLTGCHPAGAARRSTAELVRAILETDPNRPSDAAGGRAAEGPERQRRNAEVRATTPDALRRVLEGDLDTILAKALKKNPSERYPSVTALADDLRRYLRHEPIGARPDTLIYRAAKFVRRNRTATALGTFAVLALIGGLAGTISQTRRARHDAELAETQRRRADRAARLAEQQRDFALRQVSRSGAINDMNAFLLSDAAPSGKPFTARQLLETAESILRRDSGETDENRVEMLVDIGYQYNDLDQDDRARPLLEKAYALAGKLTEPSLRAKAACALANTLERAGETQRAEALVREGLAELPDEPQFALDRVFCLCRASYVARESDDVQAGVDRILEAQRLLKASHLSSSLADLTVAMDVAESYRMAGRHREAIAAFRDAFDRLAALGRDRTEKAGTLLNNWGLTEDFLGRPLEAEKLYRRAIRISSVDESESNVSPMLLNNLARTLKDLDRLAEAASYADRAYAGAKRAKDEIVVNQALIVRQAVRRERGELDGAGELLAELEPRLKHMLPAGHVAFASLASEQALLAQARGDLTAARVSADRAVALAESSSQRTLYVPMILLRRSQLEIHMRLWNQAWADASRALELFKARVGPDLTSNQVGRCYVVLGRADQELGRVDGARSAFAAALENLEPSEGANHPETRSVRQLADSLGVALENGRTNPSS
jgi:serine/threonine protein kinase